MNHATSQADIFAAVALTAALVILLGAIGRGLARRLDQPTVLGELLIGIMAGNLGYWLGIPVFSLIMHLDTVSRIFNEVWLSGVSILEATRAVFGQAHLVEGSVATRLDALLVGAEGPVLVVVGITLWLFSNLGILFLLFMAGLESSVSEMRQLGRRPVQVALAGVAGPLILGMLAAWLLLPPSPVAVYVFVAVALASTSIGLTARVFQDLDLFGTPEATLALGAAVVDDVLSLILLALVLGILISGEVHLLQVLSIVLLSLLFFGAVLRFGDPLAKRGLRVFQLLDRPTHRLLYPLFLVLILAWLAEWLGLAALIGAFAAGLVLNEDRRGSAGQGEPSLKDMMAPLEIFLAPVFFVLIGMQVNLAGLLQPGVVLLVIVLVIVAVGGKLAAGLAAGQAYNRLAVGIALLPRGEVTLIFASLGKGLGAVPEPLFSAIVMTVIATALLTPPLLRRTLNVPSAPRPQRRSTS